MNMRSSSYRSVCLICLIALLFAAIYLARHDPVQMHWMVRCPVYRLSGLKCPGCGTLRAVYNLILSQWHLSGLFYMFIIKLVE